MRIPALDRKLLRDLWLIKGQAIAIALVIGAGVGMYVLMLSTFDSLDLTRRTYYDRYRFGDVFASLKRAPPRGDLLFEKVLLVTVMRPPSVASPPPAFCAVLS